MRLDGAEFARVRVLAAPPEPVSIGWLFKNGIGPISVSANRVYAVEGYGPHARNM
jgi:hypothetical protein